LWRFRSWRGSASAYSSTFLSNVICLTLCCLLHSCTLLKPLDWFRCYLAGTGKKREKVRNRGKGKKERLGEKEGGYRGKIVLHAEKVDVVVMSGMEPTRRMLSNKYIDLCQRCWHFHTHWRAIPQSWRLTSELIHHHLKWSLVSGHSRRTLQVVLSQTLTKKALGERRPQPSILIRHCPI